jgi:NAD(P)-dependent dehydrogenase (short-subunit alcohol dehydrogenase family)
MVGSRYEIQDRVVLITGGARGIGADAAQRLVARGARVAVVDQDAEAVERKAAELGDAAVAFTADVTDADALDAAVEGAVAHFGGIDVVIANAGISGTVSTVAAVDRASFERVIEVNLLGVWRTVRAALPYVVERRGYVLPIASIAAALPVPLLAAYAASKAGVEGFARSLRMELMATGTRVGVGYFGFIDTDMVRDARAQPTAIQAMRVLPGGFSGALPVGAAGEAIVRGVQRRAKRVYAPRWVPALLALRGLSGPLDDLAARDPRFVKACRLAAQGQTAETTAAPETKDDHTEAISR